MLEQLGFSGRCSWPPILHCGQMMHLDMQDGRPDVTRRNILFTSFWAWGLLEGSWVVVTSRVMSKDLLRTTPQPSCTVEGSALSYSDRAQPKTLTSKP